MEKEQEKKPRDREKPAEEKACEEKKPEEKTEKKPKASKKTMKKTEAEEQVEWTETRIDLAMEGENLYDISFDYLKNRELMLVTMFILWARDNGRELKKRAELVPTDREKVLTGGDKEEKIDDVQLRETGWKGLKGLKDTRKQALMRLAQALKDNSIYTMGKTLKRMKKIKVEKEEPKKDANKPQKEGEDTEKRGKIRETESGDKDSGVDKKAQKKQ